MKTWFVRLIPPRPTFNKDVTESEQKIMDRHFLYWKDLNEKGVCVFGGPVLDPKGVFGIWQSRLPLRTRRARLLLAIPP